MTRAEGTEVNMFTTLKIFKKEETCQRKGVEGEKYRNTRQWNINHALDEVNEVKITFLKTIIKLINS